MKLKVVDISIPLQGNALNEPIKGGPLVVTTTEAEESPQDKVKINDDEEGSILLSITKFTLK